MLGQMDAMWTAHQSDVEIIKSNDFKDFASFAAQWLRTNCAAVNAWCSGADSDHDGNVQIDDLKTFADGWLAGI